MNHLLQYRNLSESEIMQLECQGCLCSDWAAIEVAEAFCADNIRNTRFEGSIRIGVGCHLSDIGILQTTDDATYGDGNVVSVLNEAGDGNVVIYGGLTAQMAALMVRCSNDTAAWDALREMTIREAMATKVPCTTIGDNVTITDTRELTNVVIGDDCEIAGAARLVECTLRSTAEASILVSDGVICDNCIIQAGASITDFARLYNSFVGEACHVGRGFTAENSIFFANSHMDNGEACAALCGPFAVSHHKSTLLIGGEYSFYNAGSGTNFSNHAYKMGPVHWGTLMRGSKTASGAHILWPAQTGTFTMVMGKVQTHPDTRNLPFAYLIAEGRETWAVPGRNLVTVGTYRDIGKWKKRDRRPRQGRQSLVQYDWLSPLVIQQCLEGIKLLKQLACEMTHDEEWVCCNGVNIRRTAIAKGIAYYNLAIDMAVLEALEQHEATLPLSAAGVGQWGDMLGMLAPESEITALTNDIRTGELSDINDVAAVLSDMHQAYGENKWAWFYRLIQQRHHLDTITECDRQHLIESLAPARQQWLEAIRQDAEKEYAMGDVDEAQLKDFIQSIR